MPHHSLGPSSLHALTCLIVHIHCPCDIVQIERLQTENRSLKAETSKLCGQLEALAVADRQQPAGASISIDHFRASDARYYMLNVSFKLLLTKPWPRHGGRARCCILLLHPAP